MTLTVRAVNTGCVIGFHKPALGDAEATHIPAGLYTDLIQYEASFHKIEGLDCEVIPSQDVQVLRRRVFA